MSLREFRSIVQNYVFMGVMLALSWFLSSTFSESVSDRVHGIGDHGDTLLILCGIVIVFTLGFLIYELAKPTQIPSFVLAILFGVMTRDMFATITQNPVTLTTLIVIGAILILFEGGLETPFVKFKSLLGPILSLAFVGTIINAWLFSSVLLGISAFFGNPMPLPAVILLGAAIASTDPAAIIPSFQCLTFKKTRVKHIAISESAINDVVGAVLVGIFLTLFYEGHTPVSVSSAYLDLLNTENAIRIIHTIIVGAGVGMLGYGGLMVWNKSKARIQTEDGSDAALFLALPMFCYLLASVLGGSGYLAVFIAGLMFHMRSYFRHVEHYFNHTIEGFMKPMIFMLLGAMVDMEILLQYARTGIVAGLIFMFVLRPMIVGITLVPFYWSKQRFSVRELIFLSFVRETGVIPGVLLITIQLAGIPGSEMMMAVGLWVILLTLIIEPPLTPLLAKKLGIAQNSKPNTTGRSHVGPVAVLCSRGYSFPERMQTVVNWAEEHHIDNVALLHCPEERYSTNFVADVKTRAKQLFTATNKKRLSDGKKEIHFEFICGQGLLQDNIKELVDSGDVSIIFVGAKMLDYRMQDVKLLDTPFYFMP